MSVVFQSDDANALCGTCGHELDKHGVYQGMPEEPCRWGDCECTDFTFAPEGTERNPMAWKKCTCDGTHGIHSAKCPQVAHCIQGIEELREITQSDWDKIAKMADDPQWQQTQAALLQHKAFEDAEQKAVDEYRNSKEPLRLLEDNVRNIIACMASSTIDHAPPRRPVVCEPTGWLENMSRTSARLQSDLLFYRMVAAMSSEVVREVERHNKSRIAPMTEEIRNVWIERALDREREADAANERVKIIMKAKDDWMERALAAEKRIGVVT
jgi:hypothetical protein